MRKGIAMLLVIMLLVGMMPSGYATEEIDPEQTQSVTEPASTEEPAAEEPAEEPAAEEPAAEEPAEEPVAEEPSEEPAAEAPAEEPVPEEPDEEPSEDAGTVGGEAEILTPPGGVSNPDEKYYHADHKFGFDSMTKGGTVSGVTVSVGSTALTEGNAASSNASALANGVSIAFQPGYYLHSYKIVCGDKYSCNTDAQGMAVSVSNVMSGATQASYTVTLTKTAMGHSSEKGPYWILLDVRKDEVQYKVTYNWGTLEGRLENPAPATETHPVNDVVTVKEGDADAIAQAEALGYRFLGWSNSVSGTTQQPGDRFGMPARDVALTALWEEIPEDTLNPGTGSLLIPFTKIWDDSDDAYSLRPETLTVRLYKQAEGGEKILVEEKILTGDNWSCTFDISGEALTDEDGNFYQFTVEEVVPEHYTENKEAHRDPDVIFNPAVNGGWERITPCSELDITTSGDYKSVVIVKKGNLYIVWTVEALTVAEREILFESVLLNINGMSGAKLENTVFISGTEGHYSGITVTPEKILFSATENWSFFATGFYQKSSTSANSSSITNVLNPQTVSISGTKTWVDGNNQDGLRPESITVRLYADGVEVASAAVTAADGWSWSFEELPKYADGKEIVYTVSEDPVAGYAASVSGYDLTNTHVPETINISGTKTWDDNDDQDGKRPESITVRLLADGAEVASQTVTAEDGWKWSFPELPKYAGGKEIVYTVTEDEVEGYTAKVEGFNITNTHATAVIDIEGAKTWDDADDRDGKRPDSITVRLLADGEEVASKTVTAEDGWKWSFPELPKYADGKEIVYTVTEDEVEGYTAKVEGFNITNTHAPETVTIEGSKIWQDNNDQDGIRPDSITVNLLADGQKVASATVTARDEWKWSFVNLPKYAEGKRIVYTIEELAVEGYTSTVVGFNVINVHIPETVTVSGTKTWVDGDDRDGIRPDSITVNLLANGVKVDSAEVKASLFGRWTYTFRNLPKYENGVEIVYSVEEEAVEGYTSKVEGFDITNTHETEKTELNVKKVWDDKNDENKKRPTSVKITLYANGRSTGKTLVLSEANNWAGTFRDLEKNEGGTAIKYTVKEETVNNYKATYTYSGNTATVTNTFSVIPVTGDVSGLTGHILLMGVSAAALAVLSFFGKRRFLF